MKNSPLVVILVFIFLSSCQPEATSNRKFETSFESVLDFQGFYITPQGHLGTTYHQLQDSLVHSGNFAHLAWVTDTNAPSTPWVNNNHRGYPTIQFHKTSEGVFHTPCYITFWVYLDMPIQYNSPENEWFSAATFTSDTSDNWSRTIVVNVDVDSTLRLVHVPNQGEQNYIYQSSTIKFPQKQWVEIKVYLDLDANNGYAKVFQDGVLVSYANVNGCDGTLAQAHFGLYCSPHIASGFVVNDDLTIEEVDGE